MKALLNRFFKRKAKEPVQLKIVKAKRMPNAKYRAGWIYSQDGLRFSPEFYFVWKGKIRVKRKTADLIREYAVRSFDEIYPVIALEKRI